MKRTIKIAAGFTLIALPIIAWAVLCVIWYGSEGLLVVLIALLICILVAVFTLAGLALIDSA